MKSNNILNADSVDRMSGFGRRFENQRLILITSQNFVHFVMIKNDKCLNKSSH